MLSAACDWWLIKEGPGGGLVGFSYSPIPTCWGPKSGDRRQFPTTKDQRL